MITQTHLPTNVDLTFGVAVWVWTSPLTYNTLSLHNLKKKKYLAWILRTWCTRILAEFGIKMLYFQVKKLFFRKIHSKLSGKKIFVTNFSFLTDSLKPPHSLNSQNMLSVRIFFDDAPLNKCSYNHYPLPSFPQKVILSVLASYGINCINKTQINNHLTIKSQSGTHRQGLC